MGVIRVLPEQIANKIAAGEVIERPASIVKELIENALDAGATVIDLTVEHGGKSLIRVSDDGIGMDPQDAKLAFQRHATSKVRAMADLETIESYGFRGEALPSVAAVSRTRLVTRPEKAAAGTEVVVEGGNFAGVQEHPCRKGTIVEVRDLFFNTPARRKFLKSDSTELAYVQEVVSHLSLSALGVRVTFKESGRTLLDLSPTDQILQRAGEILGEEAAKELLEVDEEKDGVRLWGVIGKPVLTRASRREIRFFINRRWVKSLPLAYALQAGYHGLLMEGRYPVAALFIDLDLKRVDVNVHPTKQQVRISNEPEITSLMKEAVEKSLGKAPDLAHRLQTKRYALSSGPKATQTWGVVSEKQGMFMETAGVEAIPRSMPPLSLGQEPIAFRDSLHVTKILGQIHNTFLILETQEGMMVIDQHAAHERVMFEALLRNFEAAKPESQALLLEEVLKLPPRQRDLFKEALPLLTRVGFEVESIEPSTVIIRSVPAVFTEVNPVGILQAFLEEMDGGKMRTTLQDHKETMAALFACKRRSVKAGDPMAPQEIRALLIRLAQCRNPFTCPHGRPVFITQSLSDLEKQFKRG